MKVGVANMHFCLWTVVCSALLVLGGCNEPVQEEVIEARVVCVDGQFQDWDDMEPIAVDAQGDAKQEVDVTQVYACTNGSVLSLRFDVGTLMNLQGEVEEEAPLTLTIGLPDGRRLLLNPCHRTATVQGDKKESVASPEIGWVILPSYAAREFETCVDLKEFDVGPGSEVSVQFSGSDQLAEPAKIRFEAEWVEPDRRSPERTVGTDVRIVSLNTKISGLTDRRRSEAMGRLLRSVEGDIYCFQEEWDSYGMVGALEDLLPVDPNAGVSDSEENVGDPNASRADPNDRPWNVHRVLGCAIASRHQLIPFGSDTDRQASAVVKLPNDQHMVVICIHLKSRGILGSYEDKLRIEQAREIVDLLEEFRQGYLDPELRPYKDSGVVIIGDYNLVGSRKPLEEFTESAELGLAHRPLGNLIGESVATWRSQEGAYKEFLPAVMDYTVYSEQQLSPRNGFILDSQKLNRRELRELDLEEDDSQVSDHLMVVADFAFNQM